MKIVMMAMKTMIMMEKKTSEGAKENKQQTSLFEDKKAKSEIRAIRNQTYIYIYRWMLH